ncbi:endonuclease domain-containing protein [Hyphomicrobium sp. 2TAF46]|uniref:endonuclease domain-containing protein n=1 Tax=Hyphomicrobium sp. 2TAF46 TaxID=3233019 RepID=UPI003F91AF74
MRGTQPWKANRARVLRSKATAAEDKLWFHLRDRRLGGFKFVRQFPIENYFADFACRDARLIVEIDGGTHDAPSELANDSKRTQTLMALGYEVVRVHNNDVCENIDGVLDQILAALTAQDI